MEKEIDLTPFAKKLFVRIFLRMVQHTPKGQLPKFKFYIRDFAHFIIQYVYDYQAIHQMDRIAPNTAEIFGYEERQIYRIKEK